MAPGNRSDRKPAICGEYGGGGNRTRERCLPTVTATRPVALRRSARTEKRTGLDSEREASAHGNIPMSGCFGQTRGLHKVAITYSRQSPKLEGVRAPWEGRVRG
jgi:hypothetical protein